MKISMKNIIAGLADTFAKIKQGDIIELKYSGYAAGGKRYKVEYTNQAKGLVGLQSKSKGAFGANIIQNVNDPRMLSLVVGRSSYTIADIRIV